MKLIGYARVSTGEQQTIEHQADKLRAYSKTYGYNLVSVCYDRGESGKNINRPGFKRMMHMLRDKKEGIDGVIITKLDRLSRSIRDYGNVMDTFNRLDKTLVSVYDMIDTSTANGRMVSNLLMMIAQWEHEIICERTQAAMDYLRTQNRRIGRNAPYGWRIDPDDDKYLIPNMHEMEFVQLIREYDSIGLGNKEITNLINDKGYTNRAGNPFCKSTIWRIRHGKKKEQEPNNQHRITEGSVQSDRNGT